MELYLLTPFNRKINLKMNNQILYKRMIMEAKDFNSIENE
jgi:hypothetical protein